MILFYFNVFIGYFNLFGPNKQENKKLSYIWIRSTIIK